MRVASALPIPTRETSMKFEVGPRAVQAWPWLVTKRLLAVAVAVVLAVVHAAGETVMVAQNVEVIRVPGIEVAVAKLSAVTAAVAVLKETTLVHPV